MKRLCVRSLSFPVLFTILECACSIQLQMSTPISGNVLLQSLVSGRQVNSFALCGQPLNPPTPKQAKALRQLWEKGPPKLMHESSDHHHSLTEVHYDKNLQKLASFGPCELASAPLIRVDPQLETLFAQNFQAAIDAKAWYGSETKLSRYDLFHGHVFRTNLSVLHEQISLVGILFHCCEYPNPENDSGIMLNVPLGYCQSGSNCHPNLLDWRFRNILWSVWWHQYDDDRTTKQGMWLLDGASREISDLRVDATPFGPDCPNAVWEGHLGDTIGDVYYIDDTIFCAHLTS